MRKELVNFLKGVHWNVIFIRVGRDCTEFFENFTREFLIGVGEVLDHLLQFLSLFFIDDGHQQLICILPKNSIILPQPIPVTTPRVFPTNLRHFLIIIPHPLSLPLPLTHNLHPTFQTNLLHSISIPKSMYL